MKCILVLLFVLLSPGFVQAGEFDQLDQLSPPQFTGVTEDLASLLVYRGVQPAEPYGTVGFDYGIEASAIRLAHPESWQRATGDDTSTLALLRLAGNKGLPHGFDVGGFIATAPGTELREFGMQVRYALMEGGVVKPALGLRAAGTWLRGGGSLDAHARSLDISLPHRMPGSAGSSSRRRPVRARH